MTDSQGATVDIVYLPLTTQGFDENLSASEYLLDDIEKARLNRFKIASGRSLFLQSRKILKTALSEQLSVPAERLFLEYSDNGKPFLDSRKGHYGEYIPYFSISHCKGGIAISISHEENGIDIEELDRAKRYWQRGAEFINAHAATDIAKATTNREAALIFSTYWTCLEAQTKLKDGKLLLESKDLKLIAKTNNNSRYQHHNVNFWTHQLADTLKISVASYTYFKKVRLFRWPQLGEPESVYC